MFEKVCKAENNYPCGNFRSRPGPSFGSDEMGGMRWKSSWDERGRERGCDDGLGPGGSSVGPKYVGRGLGVSMNNPSSDSSPDLVGAQELEKPNNAASGYWMRPKIESKQEKIENRKYQ